MGVLRTTLLGLVTAAAAAAEDEGSLRNSTPLPDQQVAAAALRAGDDAWDASLAATEAERRSSRAQAFDAWRNALLLSAPGDGLRLLPDPEARRTWLPDPGGTHERRSEGAAAAVQRRLAAIPPGDLGAWIDRFAAQADAALARELSREDTSMAGIGEVERTFPATSAAARAALALADLELERGRPSAAAVWSDRAARHLDLGDGRWAPDRRAALAAAIDRRRGQAARLLRAVFVGDHSAPQPALGAAGPNERPAEGAGPTGEPPALRLSGAHRISGLARTPKEPFGRGLGSGAAFLVDGSVLVQGAHGLLLLAESETVGWKDHQRTSLDVIFGTNRPLVRASSSAGGWKSYPATDGRRVALVFGRADRRRPFLDIEVPPAGNALGVVEHTPSEHGLDPLWVMRDGYVVLRPARKQDRGDLPAAPGGGAAGGVAEGWTFGRGWEFQPGPVMVDDALLVLARGIGDATHDATDHADEVRLFALEAATGAVRWTREITKERGLIDPALRGRAGSFATTTMPLTVDRSTGHLL
ncbi:MAG: hypothetical protein PVJ89_13870, partial [Planctomycetota bacterium]